MQGRRGEGAVEGLQEPSAGPLHGRGGSRGLPQRLSPCPLLPVLPVLEQRPQVTLRALKDRRALRRVAAAALRAGLFLLRAGVDGGFRRFHLRIAALLVGTKDGSFVETLHPAVTAPGERKAAAPKALKGRYRAFARIWKKQNRTQRR